MKEKDLRIVFYGTPEIAAYQLKWLKENGYNIAGVVTTVDKPVGRGLKTSCSAVKAYALQEGLRVFQPEKLSDPLFVEQIRQLKPQIQIVVAFRMMPECIYGLAEYATFNLHTSLLPQYRGAAPINWAIINGEARTGMTTFILNDKIDCGDIILQEEIEITKDMTAGELHDKMMLLAPLMIEETIRRIVERDCSTISQPQENGVLKPAPKIFKSDTRVDWTRSGKEIVDFVRGLSPYPTAVCTFFSPEENKEYGFKLFKVSFEPFASEKKVAGEFEIVSKDRINVTCSDGYIQLLDLQLNGKKRMSVAELIRGFKIKGILMAKT